MASKQNQMKRLGPDELASFYMTAKERVIDAGFADEIDWQADVNIVDWSETTFLREAAWVVLSSGFREVVIRRCFANVSTAFLHWVSAEAIVEQHEMCRSSALLAFGNQRKIDAILQIVHRVAFDGIDVIREAVSERGTQFIQELPFMGQVTSCHLAKNLGLSIVKPDRHLTRLAASTGYESAEQMCRTIADIVGDTLPVIDIVIWRYATIAVAYDLDSGSVPVVYRGAQKLHEATHPPGGTLRVDP